MTEPTGTTDLPPARDDATGAAGSASRSLAHADLLRSVGAPPDPGEHIVLESCHSTWLFDTTRKQFCRLLHRGPDRVTPVVTEWRSYFRLLMHPDSEAFVVFLDGTGTRLLRSWRHLEHCAQCGGNVTSEYSLDDLRRVAGA
jgi:hypothetical protein